MIDVLALVTFLFINLALGLAVLPRLVGVFLGPMISAALSLISAFVHLYLDVPISVVFLVISLIANALVLAIKPTRQRIRDGLIEIKHSSSSIYLLSTYLFFVVASYLSAPPPLAWDARSLWYSAASWLEGPAIYYFEAMFLQVAGWQDYPLGGPAAMAVTFELSGVTENFALGGRAIGALVISALAMAAVLVIESFGQNRNKWFVVAGFISFLLTGFFIADGMLNNGYMDALQAASVGLFIALCLFAIRESNASISVLVALTIVGVFAQNIKQEGFWFILGAGLLLTLWSLLRRHWSYLILLPVLLIARLGWSAFGDSIGMPSSASTTQMAANVPEILNPGSRAWVTLGRVFEISFGPQTFGLLALLVLASSFILFSDKLSARQVATSLFLLLVGLGYLLIVLATYSLGDIRDDIDWWLGTSYSRVISSFEVVVWLSLLVTFLSYLPEQRTIRTRTKKKARL